MDIKFTHKKDSDTETVITMQAVTRKSNKKNSSYLKPTRAELAKAKV